jgi:hypothetical protein
LGCPSIDGRSSMTASMANARLRFVGTSFCVAVLRVSPNE